MPLNKLPNCNIIHYNTKKVTTKKRKIQKGRDVCYRWLLPMRMSRPHSLPYNTYLRWRLDSIRQSPLAAGHTHPLPHLLPFPISVSCLLCAKPERGMMIQCYDCHGWIHGPCANLGSTEATALSHLSCSACSRRSVGAYISPLPSHLHHKPLSTTSLSSLFHYP